MILADAILEANKILAHGESITYPSGSAARHVRAVIKNLVDAVQAARPTQTDFIEIQKDHVFSPEEAEARKRWALEFIPKLAGVARALGYGVFQGGTLVRDIDLVAVPWQQPTAQAPHRFVLDLCASLNLQMGNHGDTIAGHSWFALWDRSHRDHQIDLKVMHPAHRGRA
jgi:hypothetical protein